MSKLFSHITVVGSTTTGALTATGASSLSTLTTSGLATLDSLSTTGNATVGGSLTVNGTLTTVDSENVLIQDNYTVHNFGYTAQSGQTGGLVVNYNPDTAATAYVSKTASSITVADETGLVVGDIVMFAGGSNAQMSGLYEIASITGAEIGIATSPVLKFTRNAVDAGDNTGGTLQRVSVAVLQANVSGAWETASGATVAALQSSVTSIGDLAAAVLLAGRVGGQTINGGASTTNNLTLRANAIDLITGYVELLDTTDVTANTAASGALRVAGGAAFAQNVTLLDNKTFYANNIEPAANGGTVSMFTATTDVVDLGGGAGSLNVLFTASTARGGGDGALNVSGGCYIAENLTLGVGNTVWADKFDSTGATVSLELGPELTSGDVVLGSNDAGCVVRNLNETDVTQGTVASGGVRIVGGLSVAKNVTLGLGNSVWADKFDSTAVGTALTVGGANTSGNIVIGGAQTTGEMTIGNDVSSGAIAIGNASRDVTINGSTPSIIGATTLDLTGPTTTITGSTSINTSTPDLNLVGTTTADLTAPTVTIGGAAGADVTIGNTTGIIELNGPVKNTPVTNTATSGPVTYSTHLDATFGGFNVFTGNGSFNIELPTRETNGTAMDGMRVTFVNKGTGIKTLVPYAADTTDATIGGATSLAIPASGGVVTLVYIESTVDWMPV